MASRRTSQRHNRGKLSRNPLENPNNCWICLQYIPVTEERLHPCYCVAPVHRQCLEEWLKVSVTGRCPVCRYAYQFRYKLGFIGCGAQFWNVPVIYYLTFIILNCLPIFGFSFQDHLGFITLEQHLIANSTWRIVFIIGLYGITTLVFAYLFRTLLCLRSIWRLSRLDIWKKYFMIIVTLCLEMSQHGLGILLLRTLIDNGVILDHPSLSALSFFTFILGLIVMSPVYLIFWCVNRHISRRTSRSNNIPMRQLV